MPRPTPISRPPRTTPRRRSINNSVIQRHHDYEIDEARERLNFAQIHAWLRETYWSPDVEREKVERAAQFSSLVIGAYNHQNTQVGYLRVISDQATFAYICDVYVDAAHRGKGIARAMVDFALSPSRTPKPCAAGF